MVPSGLSSRITLILIGLSFFRSFTPTLLLNLFEGVIQIILSFLPFLINASTAGNVQL